MILKFVGNTKNRSMKRTLQLVVVVLNVPTSFVILSSNYINQGTP